MKGESFAQVEQVEVKREERKTKCEIMGKNEVPYEGGPLAN